MRVNIYTKLQMQTLASQLGAYGFQKSKIKEITGLSEDFISKVFVNPQEGNRRAEGWLQTRGGEKTNADRILRFLLRVHGDDLSTLKLDCGETILKLYEGYIINDKRGFVTINRFYYFALELASNKLPVLTCKSCKKAYVTVDARIKECGVCHDIESRTKHMESFRRRTQAQKKVANL